METFIKINSRFFVFFPPVRLLTKTRFIFWTDTSCLTRSHFPGIWLAHPDNGHIRKVTLLQSHNYSLGIAHRSDRPVTVKTPPEVCQQYLQRVVSCNCLLLEAMQQRMGRVTHLMEGVTHNASRHICLCL